MLPGRVLGSAPPQRPVHRRPPHPGHSGCTRQAPGLPCPCRFGHSATKSARDPGLRVAPSRDRAPYPSSAINLGIQNGRVWALEPPWSDAGCGLGSFDDADLALQICPLSASSPSPADLSMQVDCYAREASSSSSPAPCWRTRADSPREPPEEPSPDTAHRLNAPSDSDAEHYEQEEAWRCNETRVAAQRCVLVYNCNIYRLSVQACFCLGRLA